MGGACLGRRLRLIALAPLVACQSEPSGTVSLPLTNVASIRIFTVPSDVDWTAHLPLTAGTPVRLKLRLFTADGREVTPLPHPIDMSFSFAPTTLATAMVADGNLLVFDISPTGPVDTVGDLEITLTEPATATTKSFGPFQVLIHPGL